MAEQRKIIGHVRHVPQGPHLPLPADFVPLQLCVQSEHLHIEVNCPCAIVGRHSEADVRLAYADVSRRHCRLVFENGQWRVYDLMSLNGVFVNNVPTAETTLYAGDLLGIGCVRLLVELATRMPALKPEEDERNAKLRQIADMLPMKMKEPRTK